MIHVVARVTLKPDQASVFLRELRALATLVRQEPGCVDYFPAQDVPTGHAAQNFSPDCVTILEKWSSRAALMSHLRSGHMRAFQDRVKDIVLETILQIIEEV